VAFVAPLEGSMGDAYGNARDFVGKKRLDVKRREKTGSYEAKKIEVSQGILGRTR